MRIVSRKNEDQIQIERLRGAIEAATDGFVSPAHTLPELIGQVEDAMLHFMGRVERLEHSCDNMQREAGALAAQCAMHEGLIEGILRVGYDEALDFATVDLMDAFLGSGAATSTFCGDISFDPSITLTKQDVKPILRQAIITWVNSRVR